MKALDHASVSRSGVTAPRFNFETSRCMYGADSDGLAFRFNIASKGGGQTDILLRIGTGDLPSVLYELASSHPRAADLFLGALRDAQAERARSLTVQLQDLATRSKAVADYMRTRYYEKPSGDDDEERVLMTAAEAIESLLGELNEWTQASVPPKISRRKAPVRRK